MATQQCSCSHKPSVPRPAAGAPQLVPFAVPALLEASAPMLSGPVLLCWGSFCPSLSSPPWPLFSVRCHALEWLVQARPCLPTHTLPELIFKHNCDQDTLLPLLLGSGRKMQKSSNKKEKNHKTACHRSKKIRKFPKEEWPTFGCGKFHGKKKSSSQSRVDVFCLPKLS